MYPLVHRVKNELSKSAAGSTRGLSTVCSTAEVSPARIRHALARATTRPPASSSDSTSWIRLPGRAIRARVRSSPSGTGPSRSTAIREMRVPSVPSSRSMARVSMADGGAPCWSSGPHALTVCSDARNTSQPSSAPSRS